VSKLGFALTVYVGVAILAWFTLSDQRIRLVTLAILAMFAIRTAAHEFRKRAEAENK